MEYSLSTIALILLRATSFVALLPLGSSAFSVRAILAISLSIGAFPNVDKLSAFSYEALVLNIIYGASLAIPIALIVSVMSMWGELIDVGRGLSISNFISPGFDDSPSVLSVASNSFAVYLIFASGLALSCVESFVKSTTVFPLDINNVNELNGISLELLDFLLYFLSKLTLYVLPILLVFSSLDFGLGVLGKIVPSLSLVPESFQIKSALFLIVLVAAISSGLMEEASFMLIAMGDLTANSPGFEP